jgi:hypothetical protein
MQLLKQIGSILLLMIYSLGMVHGFIPHSHYAELADGVVFEHGVEHGSNHLHHHHDANDTGNHTHVAHNGHLDHGFMDILICILSEAHQTDIADLFISGNSLNEVSLDAAKLQLAAVLVSFMTIHVEEIVPKTAVCPSDVELSYRYSHISAASRRGPPTVS